MPIRDNEQFCKYFLGNTEEEAYENYFKFHQTIKLLANNYAVFGVDSNDLFQEGLIGLARAVKAFDEKRSSGERAFKIFAIYHIKNAIKEFITKQAVALKIPQYLKDGIRLLTILKELLSQSGENVESTNVFEIWELAKNRKIENKLDLEIRTTVEKFIALTERSSTSPTKLLNRLESLPLQPLEIELIELDDSGYVDYENYILNVMDSNSKIRWLTEVLTEDEFDLLWQRYVDDVPLRVLAEERNTSSVNISNILKKLKNKLNQLADVN